MAGLNLDMSGFAELAARLNQLASQDATKAGNTAVRAGAVAGLKDILGSGEVPVSNVAEGATARHHRKNGRVVEDQHHKIINSMKVNRIKTEGTTVTASINVGKAFQARFVEFGTIHQGPNPFLLRAFTSAEQTMLDAVSKSLGRGLTRRGV